MSAPRLTQEELLAIQTRLSKSSRGPWRAEDDQVFSRDDVLADICCGEISQALADAVFVASSREDIERLLAEVKLLQKELAAAKGG
jgi:hypothetical protein